MIGNNWNSAYESVDDIEPIFKDISQKSTKKTQLGHYEN